MIIDEAELFGPPSGKKVKCRGRTEDMKKCKWEGTLAECKKKRISSTPEEWRALAGREGWEWFCPVCGWMVDSYYTKMS